MLSASSQEMEDDCQVVKEQMNLDFLKNRWYQCSFFSIGLLLTGVGSTITFLINLSHIEKDEEYRFSNIHVFGPCMILAGVILILITVSALIHFRNQKTSSNSNKQELLRREVLSMISGYSVDSYSRSIKNPSNNSFCPHPSLHSNNFKIVPEVHITVPSAKTESEEQRVDMSRSRQRGCLKSEVRRHSHTPVMITSVPQVRENNSRRLYNNFMI